MWVVCVCVGVCEGICVCVCKEGNAFQTILLEESGLYLPQWVQDCVVLSLLDWHLGPRTVFIPLPLQPKLLPQVLCSHWTQSRLCKSVPSIPSGPCPLLARAGQPQRMPGSGFPFHPGHVPNLWSPPVPSEGEDFGSTHEMKRNC